MPYASQADIENALGIAIVASIFDDDLDGVADSAPIEACLAYADAEVESYLSGVYDDLTFPISPVPAAVKYAAVDWCCAYAARRRPDLVRAMGEVSWDSFRKAAEDKMDNFVKAKQRIKPNDTPPANVGAEVVTTTIERTTCPRRFDKMGDF